METDSEQGLLTWITGKCSKPKLFYSYILSIKFMSKTILCAKRVNVI